jgi:3-methyl-2-oxobutanoate hydroxymethyltransferase
MSPAGSSFSPKVTIAALQSKKHRREPITMLTAYDYPTAQALDRAGVDAVLVGDSLAMVVLGHPNTLAVTMEEMLHHCRAVSRAAARAHVVGDLPFMSYQVSPSDAVRNAGRMVKEGGVDSVKLEGGRAMAATVEAIVAAGIPVMGHLGLTPQSLRQLDGWKDQAKSADAARRLLEDAQILEHAGCYAVVVEAIPDRVARLVAERLEIPVIGIGAGPHCDGQVLVTHDLLGLIPEFGPKFVRRYADLGAEMARAFGAYIEDVRAGLFPSRDESYSISDAEYDRLLEALGERRYPAAVRP